MSGMFYSCSSLNELNISNFNNNNETDILFMLEGCPSNLSLYCNNDLIKKEYENLFK